VKLTWTVSTTAQLSIATQYAASSSNIVTAQGSSAPSLQPSTAGVCSGTGTTETAFNLTYGTLVPSTSAEVGCNYQNAIAAEVMTNDSNGYKLNEFEVSAPTGITFCAFPNGSTTGSATTTVASAQSTAPVAYTGSACANGSTVLAAGTSPTNTSPGQSNPIGGGSGTAGLETATAPGSGNFTWGSASTSTTTSGAFFSEDLQINLAANQPAGTAQSAFIIIQLIPN